MPRRTDKHDDNTECPLCHAVTVRGFLDNGRRRYFRCDSCSLTFLDRAQLPDRAAERAEYQLHDNRPDDPGYRRFLSRAVTPLCERLEARGMVNAQGLDFGCGPGPALSRMMAEHGHEFRSYDPLFFPDPSLLERRYDTIACTEVVEHFHHPAIEFSKLERLMRPDCVIVVMTSILTDDATFEGWHYIREKSHVAFYRSETMAWIARQFGWEATAVARNVWLFETFKGRPATNRVDQTPPEQEMKRR